MGLGKRWSWGRETGWPTSEMMSHLLHSSYAVIAYGCAECPRLVCGRQDCRTEFCYHCRQPWHPNSSCEQAWQEWNRQAPGAVGLSTQLIQKEEATSHSECMGGSREEHTAASKVMAPETSLTSWQRSHTPRFVGPRLSARDPCSGLIPEAGLFSLGRP